MSVFLTAVALAILLTLAAGLVRVILGPSRSDRMIGVQLFGTAGVAVLLVLAEATGTSALRDVALVMALLASVIVVAYVKRGWVRRPDTPGEER